MDNIFKKKVAARPYDYPGLMKYKDAIRHSYWIHTEFNIESDVQDFKVGISDSERSAISKTMLAISQIEVSVKTFWAKIYDKMPRPEIASVGLTFAESEVRHHDAYAALLERLGLEKDFDNIYEIPAIIDRVKYLGKSIEGIKSRDNKKFALSVLLFSVFVEHVSLFSQFLIMMSFNKHTNKFKGISNIVEATSKEEVIHGQFGIDLVKIIREEFPEWFDEDLNNEIIKACKKAANAEIKILDWIFEDGELNFLPKDEIINFVHDRFNESLGELDIKPIFIVDSKKLNNLMWFKEEILATKGVDFFVKRSINYSKKAKSITEDDLF
jgi:ribonucleoside-diphosphate reductase beta chain